MTDTINLIGINDKKPSPLIREPATMVADTRPLCTWRGYLGPGAMCAYVSVGTERCCAPDVPCAGRKESA